MQYKLSPSSIKLFLDCPRCFWLDKHGIWKRPTSGFPTLPNGMDRILKDHFDRFRDKGLLPPELCDNGHCRDLKLFGENKTEKELLSTWRNNFKGIRWIDENGNQLFGAVDNILKRNDLLIVLDYKTRGSPVKEETIEYSQNQLDTYNFLLQKNGHQTENYAFLLFYIPSKVIETGEVIFDTDLHKIKINPKSAERTFKEALKIIENDLPIKTCQWCEKV